MPAPPSRASLFDPISKSLANTRFGELYDYITGLLGATGNAAEARAALGLPNSGPLSGLRNLVINANFAINQRGAVSGAAVGAANTYTLDRWRVVTSGQAMSWSASGAGNIVTAPAGGMEQVIEGASIAGGTYVLNWTGTATATVNGSAVSKGGTATLTANTNATLRFSGGTVSLVQLEPGSVVTEFEARPYALEELLCRRFGRRLFFVQGQTVSIGMVYSATESRHSVVLDQPMRATPTVTLGSVSGYELLVPYGATLTSISASDIGPLGFNLSAVVSGGGMTLGRASQLRADSGGSGLSIFLNAEL